LYDNGRLPGTQLLNPHFLLLFVILEGNLLLHLPLLVFRLGTPIPVLL